MHSCCPDQRLFQTTAPLEGYPARSTRHSDTPCPTDTAQTGYSDARPAINVGARIRRPVRRRRRSDTACRAGTVRTRIHDRRTVPTSGRLPAGRTAGCPCRDTPLLCGIGTAGRPDHSICFSAQTFPLTVLPAPPYRVPPALLPPARKPVPQT